MTLALATTCNVYWTRSSLRFFVRTAAEGIALLNDRARKLQNIGLQWNAGKTSAPTRTLRGYVLPLGIKFRDLKGQEARNSLRCMINMAGSRNTHLDPQVYKWHMPGSCPVKQLQPDPLREKRGGKKTTTSSSNSNCITSVVR